MERLQRERRVADPRVPVVPVALAAGRFRQRRGERGHGRARRHEREALDRQGRTLQHGAPRMIDRARTVEPASPELHRGGDPGFSLVDGGGGREPLGPRQCAVRAFARGQDVPCPDPPCLDPQGHVGREPHRDAGPGGVGGMPVVPDEIPLRLGASVVEHRLADEFDLDLPLQASDGSHQRVIGIFIGRGPRVRRDDVLARPGPQSSGHRAPPPIHPPCARWSRGRSCRVRRPARWGR